MEIHELNTFSGTLGSGNWFATDNGTDTSKVSAKDIIDEAVSQADSDTASAIATAMEDVKPFVYGFGYGTCATSGTTANSTRYVTLTGYELSKGGIIAVKFTYDVPAGSYLSVNSEASKRIYFQGSTLAAGIISAGDTAFFMYDGSYYRLLGVDSVASAIKERTFAQTFTPSITRSTGGTLSAIQGRKNGGIITVAFIVTYSTSVSSGGNLFTGTLSNYVPSMTVYGCSYLASYPIIASITSTGAITVRNASPSAVTASAGVGFTFVYALTDI